MKMHTAMKVLIVGPRYFNFLSATQSAFRELGWETLVEGYEAPLHPYTFFNRMLYKLSSDKPAVERRSVRQYQPYIMEVFSRFKPDLVFVLNGDFLLPETLDAFRGSAKVALWMFDNRVKLPGAEGHHAHVDALFCFDMEDVVSYKKDGIEAHFLPQACDMSVYRPLSGTRKDIDILFVGNLLYSPRRKRLMNAVIDRYPERTIRVYGWYQPWFKGLGAWLKRPHKHIYKNVQVSSARANSLYNQARIVLNIHQESQRDGANPRVFEICGSGAYQICDWNPYVASLFPSGAIGLYHDEEELFSLVGEALKSDREEAASRAHSIVVREHTFKNRMEQVLKTLSMAE